MERPPLEYRNVVVEGDRVRGEYTTTEPIEAFPHGSWARFDSKLVEWWVRLAMSDPRAREALRRRFGSEDVVAELRDADGAARFEALALARRHTGDLLVASLLGVEAGVVTGAVAAVAQQRAGV